MIIWRPSLVLISSIAILAAGCDAGTASKTPDEFAADSALAADLALANSDTLLVDSIGAYREPDAAERDTVAPPVEVTDGRDRIPSTPAPAAAPVTAPTTPPASPPPAPAVSKPAPAPSSPAPVTKASAPAPRLSGTRACTSPSTENQSECLRTLIAASDARLNRVYRALISEMRRQEKVAPGAKDPTSVAKLRIAQRQWIVYRDNECRKRGRGKEGRLWARPRARCLGEFAGRRANELADNFSKLTAH